MKHRKTTLDLYVASGQDQPDYSTERHVLPNGHVLIFTASTAFPGRRLLLHISPQEATRR